MRVGIPLMGNDIRAIEDLKLITFADIFSYLLHTIHNEVVSTIRNIDPTRNSPAGQGRAEGKGIFNCLKSPISVRSTSTQKQFRSFSPARAPRVGLTG